MVRLDHWISACQMLWGDCSTRRLLLDYLIWSFNSSLVRLGVWGSYTFLSTSFVSIPAWYDWERQFSAYRTENLLFQFQLGTIGRSKTLIDKLNPIKFQFQLGTIGSRHERLLSGLCYRFNSSLVRLGALTITGDGSFSSSFNSSLVRLGVMGKHRSSFW